MKNNETKEVFMPCKYIKNDSTVLDFTGLYEVSNLGRVKSLNYNHTGKEGILTPSIWRNDKGIVIYRVLLRKGNKRYTLSVHRIVMSSFDADNYKPGYIVNHKTERTSTSCINELSNLEWISQKENVNTEHCKTLHAEARSKRVKVINLITKEINTYASYQEAETALGLSVNSISVYIRKYKGFYKKGNLHFSYI